MYRGCQARQLLVRIVAVLHSSGFGQRGAPQMSAEQEPVKEVVVKKEPTAEEEYEALVADRMERFNKAKIALEKLNAGGLNRRASDSEPNNGLGSGWAKTVTNMTATGLVGLLLFLAQNEGFKILRGLMEESKEQRRGFAENIEALRKEREVERQIVTRHSDEATAAMREIAKGLRALTNQKKPDGDEDLEKQLNDEMQGLARPKVQAAPLPTEIKADTKTAKKTTG